MTRTPFKLLAAAAVMMLSATAAYSAPVNLITNGSFENGLAGWTQGGTFIPGPPGNSTAVVAISYGSPTPYPTGAYGEAVPVPADATLSPDAAGALGAYFVADGSINESLTQQIFLSAGTYRIGFDVYAPRNGYSNPFDASFSAQIAGVTLANYLVSSQPAATWINFSGLATIGTTGTYSASFVFNTPGLGQAKDVVIDRVFVVASTEVGGTAIPEPETLALFGIASVALAFVRRRKSA